MKMMKKLATILLAICLIVPCFSMLTYAADGRIMFTDPQTKAGEVLEIKGVVEKHRGNFGKIEIVMTYDTSYLKFNSGDGVTETTSGELTYVGDATNDTGNRKEFYMKFDVLKAGTTKVEIKDSTIKNVSGTVLNYTRGSSTITIAEGEVTTTDVPTVDPSTTSDAVIDIDGESYTISNTIPQNEIPEGYTAATLEYDLVEYNVVYSEEFGLYLAYMLDSENVGSFFMYVEETATFAPYEEITVSDKLKIALLSDVSEIELPSEYVSQDVLSATGKSFPAWQNEENPDFLILYAINNSGEKSLYQLDAEEGTYQRFIAPEVVIEELDNPFIEKLSALLENHLDYVIMGTGLGFILFIIIIVVLSVKLYNRNAELDEIYDEYGIDDEDEDEDEETEDDVIIEFDDYDDEDEDNNEDNNEMEMLVQEGMKEVFPEEDIVVEVEKVPEKVTANTVEIPIEKVVQTAKKNEDTLGEALAKQLATEKETKEEYYDDDDGFLENFSVDFIDLDD